MKSLLIVGFLGFFCALSGMKHVEMKQPYHFIENQRAKFEEDITEAIAALVKVVSQIPLDDDKAQQQKINEFALIPPYVSGYAALSYGCHLLFNAADGNDATAVERYVNTFYHATNEQIRFLDCYYGSYSNQDAINKRILDLLPKDSQKKFFIGPFRDYPSPMKELWQKVRVQQIQNLKIKASMANYDTLKIAHCCDEACSCLPECLCGTGLLATHYDISWVLPIVCIGAGAIMKMRGWKEVDFFSERYHKTRADIDSTLACLIQKIQSQNSLNSREKKDQ